MATTSTALHTPLCDLLGCRYPIVQTAMGWVAGPELVAATTNAGGFGFLAGATIPTERIEDGILKVKRLSDDRPFGAFSTIYEALADNAVDPRLKAVFEATESELRPSRWGPTSSPSREAKAAATPGRCRPRCCCRRWSMR